MAKSDLPRGYQMADGKNPIHGVVQPEGVIIGPHDSNVQNKTFRCPRCGNEFERAAKVAVCNGQNIKVVRLTEDELENGFREVEIPREDGSTYTKRVGDNDVYVLPVEANGGYVFDNNGNPGHGPIEMEVV